MKKGAYLALSASFPEDDDIIAVGEAAAWLYIVMACDCRLRRTDGWISRQRVARLGVKGWEKRLDALLGQGLVERQESPQGVAYWLPAYLKWNKSEAQLSAAGKYGACRRYHPQPCQQAECVANKATAFEVG